MIYAKAPLPNPTPIERKTLRNFDDLILRYLNEQEQNLDNVFSNGIRLEDNLDGVFVTFTSNGVANTEDAVAHTLGKVPEGFIVTKLNKGAVLYNGGTTDTETTIYLKSTVATTIFTIFVF